MATALASADLDALAAYDTPTICNALELATPERRACGFNRRPLVAPLPGAETGRRPCAHGHDPRARAEPAGSNEAREPRLHYYAHVADAPQPSIMVMQDVDGPDRGFGAFWGEVQSNVHKALGCAGVVTDGSVRDIDTWAPGFFVLVGSVMPSHAHVDVVEIGGAVSVAGMIVDGHDLIHADRHGAVVVPPEASAK